MAPAQPAPRVASSRSRSRDVAPPLVSFLDLPRDPRPDRPRSTHPTRRRRARRTTMRPHLAAALLAALALAACGKARQHEAQASAAEGQCTRCHGGDCNQTGAPPRTFHGEGKDCDPAATATMAVGAHSAHVQAGALAGAFACTACHPDPRSGSTHLDGKVELALDGFAHDLPGNGTVPAFDAAAGTCASVYCHDAFR